MASIRRLVSPRTQEVIYRVQVRTKGRASESANFPNLKEAKAWAISVEAAIREARHFPHAAARRTSFDALAKDYAETVLTQFNEKERATRLRHLDWWSKQFAGLSLTEVTADRISKARDLLATDDHRVLDLVRFKKMVPRWRGSRCWAGHEDREGTAAHDLASGAAAVQGRVSVMPRSIAGHRLTRNGRRTTSPEQGTSPQMRKMRSALPANSASDSAAVIGGNAAE